MARKFIKALGAFDRRFDGHGPTPEAALAAAIAEYDKWAAERVADYGADAWQFGVMAAGAEAWDVFLRVGRGPAGADGIRPVVHTCYLRPVDP